MSECAAAPMVSVIIPSYNAAPFVGQAISSVLASSGVAIEVIVVDDGSSDGTWQVLEGFGERLRKFRAERGGAYRARNLGAEVARGQWLAFLDADDDWLPGKLRAQLAMADDDAGLIYTDRLNFGDVSRVKELQSDSVTLSEGDVFEPLLLGNFITLSSVLMRKSWFERLAGFATERRGVQDWDMWLRYSAEGGQVRLCREPLTRYRIHAEQMTNELDQRAGDREAVLRRALSSPRGRQVSSKVKRQAFAGLWELAAAQASPSRPMHAIGCYVRSAFYGPQNLGVYKGIVKCCLGRA
jgi:glycosyltransferase involved in cell wall biosynthesis